MGKKTTKSAKEQRIWTRADDKLYAEVAELCERLGPPWNLSNIVSRIVEIFLADGLDTAKTRIESGRAEVTDREAELRRIVHITLEEIAADHTKEVVRDLLDDVVERSGAAHQAPARKRDKRAQGDR